MSENLRRYGKPEVRLYYQKNDGSKVRIPFTPIRFSYLDSEKTDSRCTVLFQSDDYYMPDYPYFQNKSKWMVVWGYEKTEQLQSRTVYVRDIKPRYSETGFQFELVLFPKGTFLRDNHSNEVIDETDIMRVASDIAQNNGLDLVVDVENFEEDLIAENENENYKKYTVTDENGEDREIRVKIERTVPEAGLSKMDTLKFLGARAKDGPLIISMKDDSLILKQRNFKRTPIAYYEYDGGNNELIKFYPTENNTLKEADTIKSERVSDDPDSGSSYFTNWTHRYVPLFPSGKDNESSVFMTGNPTVFSNEFTNERGAIRQAEEANVLELVQTLRTKGFRVSLGDSFHKDPMIDKYYNIPGLKERYEILYKFASTQNERNAIGASPDEQAELKRIEEKLSEVGAVFKDGEVTIPFINEFTSGIIGKLDSMSDEELERLRNTYKSRVMSEPLFFVTLAKINPNNALVAEAVSQYPEYDLPNLKSYQFDINDFVVSEFKDPLDITEERFEGYTRMLPNDMDITTGLYRTARENTATSIIVPRLITESAPEDIYTQDNLINQSEIEKNESDAEVLGNPYLHSGRTVSITGVARKYSGAWYMLECEHIVDDSGYITKLTLSRNTLNKPGSAETEIDVDIDAEKEPVLAEVVDIKDGVDKGYQKLVIYRGEIDSVIDDASGIFKGDSVVYRTLGPGEYLLQERKK